MNASLSEIDSKLKSIANELKGTLIGAKGKGILAPDGYGERILYWAKENLMYSIGIYVVTNGDLIKKWSLTATCWTDIEGRRYAKGRDFMENRMEDKRIANFDSLIDEARKFLAGLTTDDLAFVAELPTQD